MKPSSTGPRPGWFRLVAVVTALAFGSACHSWHVVPLKSIESDRAVEPTTRIRVHTASDQPPVVLDVTSLSFPEVTGMTAGSEKGTFIPVTLDLRKATQIEVWSVSGWRTALLVTGIVVGVVLLAALIVLLTKTSCPFVYVDDGSGPRFVGEAYSGATSRATQRDDLMPLPHLGGHPAVVLSNEARETQFTDLLEVQVVDRAPGLRALATPDAGLLLAGVGRPPLSATDLDGLEVLPLLRDEDGRTWQTDLDAASRRPDPPSREGVVLTFPAPEPGTLIALEMDAGNTVWLDVVFGRFFALLGDRLEGYLDRSDRPEARHEALAWREREGVDLLVEMERGGRWERVAVVPTVGPASLRHFAVPLPPSGGPVVRVRVSGGVGFWQADRIALAPIEGERPRPVRIAPTRAVQGDGADVRELLAAADGRYQVLENRGERVDLTFEIPPPAPGLERDAFLHTSGYYRVHRPPQAELSAGTLHTLRDEPGSLSRFSLDLFRRYQEAAGGPVAVAR